MHLSRRKRINVLLIICSIIICNLLKIDVSMADWYGSATEPMSCGEGCSGGGGGSSTQFYMLATGYRVSVLKKMANPLQVQFLLTIGQVIIRAAVALIQVIEVFLYLQVNVILIIMIVIG